MYRFKLTTSKLSRRLSSREPGQAIVEFGIVVVIFFLLVSGIVDFGRALNAWVVMSSAAREGAREASVGANVAEITAAAQSFALVPGVDPSSVLVDVDYSDDPPTAGDTVTVTVTTDEFEIVTPLVRAAFGCPGSDPNCFVPISSSTTMRYEGAFVQ